MCNCSHFQDRHFFRKPCQSGSRMSIQDIMASQPTPSPLNITPRTNKALGSGLLHHQCPLTNPNINPKFWGESVKGGRRLTSHPSHQGHHARIPKLIVPSHHEAPGPTVLAKGNLWYLSKLPGWVSTIPVSLEKIFNKWQQQQQQQQEQQQQQQQQGFNMFYWFCSLIS